MTVQVTAPTTSGQIARGRAVVAVAALAVALFAYGTVQSLPVGLLPQIAHGLGVSLSSAGLLVTGYGLVVTVTAVPLTQATRHIPRRRLLATLLGLFTAATLLCGLAPRYAVLLTGQTLVALTHAVFLSVVAVTAAGMFPKPVRARVVSALFVGTSLAGVAGVPAGTWLGQQTDWRAPFLVISALGLLAGAVVVLLLPTGPAVQNPASTAPHPSRPRFTLLMAVTVLVVAGVFALYTYVSVFLTRAAGLSSHAVSGVLLLNGVAGLVGNGLAGALADRRPRTAMTGAVALLTVALATLAALGTHPAATVSAVALLGLSTSALITALQSRIMQIAPGSVDVASAVGSAAFNAGIAAGSFLGGRLLDAHGPRSIALTGALLTAVGLALLLAERPAPSGRAAHPPV